MNENKKMFNGVKIRPQYDSSYLRGEQGTAGQADRHRFARFILCGLLDKGSCPSILFFAEVNCNIIYPVDPVDPVQKFFIKFDSIPNFIGFHFFSQISKNRQSRLYSP
jgi:hypothetical protein